MRLRPTEIKHLTAMLDDPADDVEQLARDILTYVYETWEKRPGWVFVMNDSGILSAWGPYDTVKEGMKRVGDPIVASKPGAKGFMMKLHKDRPVLEG